jgi:hypothetical protein
MKKTLLTLAFATLAAVASYAQGTITFANTTLSRVSLQTAVGSAVYANVPISAPIVYGVFWGATADQLTLNAGALGSASATSAGIIGAGSPYQIDGGAVGAHVFMKIAGWTSAFGRDFATAKVAGQYYGETGVREVVLAATAGPGTVIWSASDLTKFQPLKLDIVPEPSVIALGPERPEAPEVRPPESPITGRNDWTGKSEPNGAIREAATLKAESWNWSNPGPSRSRMAGRWKTSGATP